MRNIIVGTLIAVWRTASAATTMKSSLAFFTALVLTMLVCPLAAQDMPQPAGDFPPVIKKVEMASLVDRTIWGLGVQFRKSENLKSPGQVVTDLDTFANRAGRTPQETAQAVAVAITESRCAACLVR